MLETAVRQERHKELTQTVIRSIVKASSELSLPRVSLAFLREGTLQLVLKNGDIGFAPSEGGLTLGKVMI
jgi:hypothetical protein